MNEMKELYEKLYQRHYMEFGYFVPNKNGGGYFKRNMLVDNIETLVKNAQTCADKGFDAYISSYGWDDHPNDNDLTWDDVIVDKIWFDFDTDNPEELPMVERAVNKFNQQLEKYFKCKNYIQFSGSKGYHLYMYLEKPVQVKQAVIKETMKWIINKFKPDYICESILNNPVRMQRLPYTMNTKSGKECKPLNIDIITTKKLSVIIRNREKYVAQQESMMETKRKLRLKNNEVRALKGDKRIDFNDIPADVVFMDLFPSEYIGKDNRAWCPIHGGSRKGTPPVKVDSKGVYCFHCGGMNAFGLALKHFGGDKSKVINYLNKKFGGS